MPRPPELQALVDRSTAALRAATSGVAATAAERIIAQIGDPAGDPRSSQPERLPVCDWIGPAVSLAAQGPRADLAAAFAAVADRLTWRRRRSADPADAGFWNGHANAVILGPGGLEDRTDVWIGATVMAPGTTYPDHDHPEEEVYLSLSPGEWWNAQMDWTDPGPRGAIYNPHGIRHAMRATEGPFLALWYLPA